MEQGRKTEEKVNKKLICFVGRIENTLVDVRFWSVTHVNVSSNYRSILIMQNTCNMETWRCRFMDYLQPVARNWRCCVVWWSVIQVSSGVTSFHSFLTSYVSHSFLTFSNVFLHSGTFINIHLFPVGSAFLVQTLLFFRLPSKNFKTKIYKTILLKHFK